VARESKKKETKGGGLLAKPKSGRNSTWGNRDLRKRAIGEMRDHGAGGVATRVNTGFNGNDLWFPGWKKDKCVQNAATSEALIVHQTENKGIAGKKNGHFICRKGGVLT